MIKFIRNNLDIKHLSKKIVFLPINKIVLGYVILAQSIEKLLDHPSYTKDS